MIRFAIAALALAGLAACDTGVTSKQPLFSPGSEAPRPGLWAVLENDGCAKPADASVQTWPGCAMPLWVSPASVTYMGLAPLRSDLVLADGRPAIAQLEPKEGWSPPFFESAKTEAAGPPDPSDKQFSYMAVQPEGASPFTSARVWVLPCPREDVAGFGSLEKNEQCQALTADAVRGVAASAAKAKKGYAAVWVAP